MYKDGALVPPERIEQSILLIRHHKVMLDVDLAALYGVETKQLVRAVKRNISRFPDDFMFQLSKDEFENLRRHFGTSSQWGGRRYNWGRVPILLTREKGSVRELRNYFSVSSVRCGLARPGAVAGSWVMGQGQAIVISY